MDKKMMITLCCLIAVLTVIIVAGVSYLYKGEKEEEVTPSAGMVAEQVEVVKEEPVQQKEPSSKPAVPATPTADTKPAPKAAQVQLPQEFKVTNCKTNKKNTLRQNADNSLELLDENGKSQWLIPFPGKICGAVGEVDYYDNKKIQFLLCDGASLHLIDRLGREVDGFPRQVNLKVTSGPRKVSHKGVNYWLFETQSGPVHYNYKATKVIEQLP